MVILGFLDERWKILWCCEVAGMTGVYEAMGVVPSR
jgi:hypothetical protein